MAEQEHINSEQLIKNALLEHLEDCQDAKKADDGYQSYLENGKISHNLTDLVKELGLDG